MYIREIPTCNFFARSSWVRCCAETFELDLAIFSNLWVTSACRKNLASESGQFQDARTMSWMECISFVYLLSFDILLLQKSKRCRYGTLPNSDHRHGQVESLHLCWDLSFPLYIYHKRYHHNFYSDAAAHRTRTQVRIEPQSINHSFNRCKLDRVRQKPTKKDGLILTNQNPPQKEMISVAWTTCAKKSGIVP